MKYGILKALALIAFFSLPCLGQENYMVCKNLDGMFSEAGYNSAGTQINRIQGPPGKKGVPGSPGPPGLPGIRGLPGTPATIDYDRISEMIEQKIRLGLEQVYSELESLKGNVTKLSESSDQICEERSGLVYEGKCYFAPYISSKGTINYSEAVPKCESAGALLAEIHSRNQQEALESFFRSKIPSSKSYFYLWIGTTYVKAERTLSFRSGKQISVDQFKWYNSYPRTSSDKIGLFIRNDGNDSSRGLFNDPESNRYYGAICEI